MSKYLSLFLLITLIAEINAQPVGGTMLFNCASGSDSSEMTTRLYYYNDESAIPDSIILIPNNGIDTVWVQKVSSGQLIDSIFIADFTLFYPFKNMTTVVAITQNLYLYAELLHNTTFPGHTTYLSTQFLPSVIYHNPREKLNFSLFRSQDEFPLNSLPLLSIQYGVREEAKSKGIRIHSLTGQTLWENIDSIGSYSFHITAQQRSNSFESYTSNIFTTVIADSNIKSTFNYDPNQVDSLGFVRIFAEPNKTATFKLCYIDKEADSIALSQYSLLNMFGDISLSKTTKNDSTFIEFSLPITEDVLNKLPASVDLVIKPVRNGRCFVRHFSFNIQKQDDHVGFDKLGKEKSDFTIYPNPAGNTFMISDPENDIDHIRIYDMMGKQCKLEYFRENQQMIISSNGLPTGIYFIKINSGKNFLTRKIAICND